MVSCIFMWWVRDKIIWREAHKFFQISLLRSCLQKLWFYSGISNRSAQYSHVLLALITGGEMRKVNHHVPTWTLWWLGYCHFTLGRQPPCLWKSALLQRTSAVFHYLRAQGSQIRVRRKTWYPQHQEHPTQAHTHTLPAWGTGSLWEVRTPPFAACKQPLRCPFSLQFRWQQEGYWLQPPGDSAVVSCLHVQGNLLSHKKTNTKNSSHHFSSPRTMELPQPYGRNYFFLPRTVQETWIFQWVEMQTFVWFLLYFNNRLQKMQGTSLLANVSFTFK